MAAEVASAFVSLIPSFRGGKRRIEKELSGVIIPASKTGGQRGGIAAGAAIAAGIKKVGAPVVAAVGATLGVALTKGFRRLTAIEDAEAKLRGLGHSAKTVDLIMKNALDSVKGTAFGLDEAATVAATAVAAGIKPGNDLRRILGLIADSATIAGVPLAEMGQIWNQVAATGKVQMEEMNRLLDRGIPVLNFLADHFGTTVADIREKISAGELSFRDFAAAMEEHLAGAALKSGNTTRGAWNNLMAALSRFGAQLLSGVFPMIREALGGMIGFVDRATEAVKPFTEALGKSLGPTLREVGKYVSAFINGLKGGSAGGGGPIVTLTNLGRAIRDFFTSLASASRGPASGFLSFLRSLWSSAQQVFPAVKGFIEELLPVLQDIGQRIMAVVGPALRDIGKIFREDVAPAIAGILPVLAPVAKFLLGVLGDTVVTVLKGVVNVVKGVLKTFAGLLTFLTGVFTGDWSKAWKGIKKIGDGVWTAIKGAVAVLINVGIVKAFRLGGNLLLKLVGKIWPGVKSLFDKGLVQVAFVVGKGIGKVLNFFKKLPGQAVNALRAIVSRVRSVFSDAFSRARSAVSGGISSVLKLVRGLPGKIRSAVGSLGSVLYNAGRSVIQGLINGITGMIGSLRNKLRSITNMLPDWKGPMTVDMKILEPSGRAIMRGFVRGIESEVSTLRDSLGDITSDIPRMAAVSPKGVGVGGSVSYGNIYVTIDAKDVEQIRTISEFFSKIQQEARRTQPGMRVRRV